MLNGLHLTCARACVRVFVCLCVCLRVLASVLASVYFRMSVCVCVGSSVCG